MAVKIGSDDDNPATDSCCVADKVVCGISASLFGMDFLSAGQCGVGNGGAFVSDAAVAGDRSTSNADRRICDFYDTAAAGAVLKPQGGNCEVLPLEKSCPRLDIGRLTLFMG